MNHQTGGHRHGAVAEGVDRATDDDGHEGADERRDHEQRDAEQVDGAVTGDVAEQVAEGLAHVPFGRAPGVGTRARGRFIGDHR
jgi:hypothetical protein